PDLPDLPDLPALPALSYFCSTVTVTGERIRTVIGDPAGNVAALRLPAIVAAVPAPAPAAPPITAPLPPPTMAPRMVPITAPPPIFCALVGASPSRYSVSVLIGTRVPSASTSVWKRIPSRARSLNFPPRSTTITEPSAREPAGTATDPP